MGFFSPKVVATTDRKLARKLDPPKSKSRQPVTERTVRSVQTSKTMTGFGSKGRPTKEGR
jgi:hypothetical protein